MRKNKRPEKRSELTDLRIGKTGIGRTPVGPAGSAPKVVKGSAVDLDSLLPMTKYGGILATNDLIRRAQVVAKFNELIGAINGNLRRDEPLDAGDLWRIAVACSSHTTKTAEVVAGRLVWLLQEHPRWPVHALESALRWDYVVPDMLDSTRITPVGGKVRDGKTGSEVATTGGAGSAEASG